VNAKAKTKAYIGFGFCLLCLAKKNLFLDGKWESLK
jgi:hypothetical protein